MASYTQLPGTLNLTVKAGDYFSTVIDFDTNLDDTFVFANVYSLVNNESLVSMEVGYIDVSLGQVSASLTEAQVSSLKSGSYGWSMYWMLPTGQKRSALGGIFEVVK
jgi:hypothetical protein